MIFISGLIEMRPPYHNTTMEAGRALRLAIEQAATQDEKVLAYFRFFPQGFSASAAKVHQAVFGRRQPCRCPVPLTSTRRALSNLVERQVLEKTNDKTDGAYGRPERKYRLRHCGQQELFG